MISSWSLLHQAAYMKTSPLYLYSCIPLLLFVQYSYISLHRALIKVLHTILNTYTLHSYFLTYLMFETHQCRICRLELGKTRFHYWVKAHISLNIGFSRHFESNQEMTHQLKSESMPERETERAWPKIWKSIRRWLGIRTACKSKDHSGSDFDKYGEYQKKEKSASSAETWNIIYTQIR